MFIIDIYNIEQEIDREKVYNIEEQIDREVDNLEQLID